MLFYCSLQVGEIATTLGDGPSPVALPPDAAAGAQRAIAAASNGGSNVSASPATTAAAGMSQQGIIRRRGLATSYLEELAQHLLTAGAEPSIAAADVAVPSGAAAVPVPPAAVTRRADGVVVEQATEAALVSLARHVHVRVFLKVRCG